MQALELLRNRFFIMVVCKATNAQSETADFAPDSATWRTGRNIRVAFDSVLLSPLYGNMTTSTKAEVHNASHCRQRRVEPRPQVMYRKFGEIWFVVFEICERANRQTRKAWQSPLCSPPGAISPAKLRGYWTKAHQIFVRHSRATDCVNSCIHVAIFPSVVECQSTE